MSIRVGDIVVFTNGETYKIIETVDENDYSYLMVDIDDWTTSAVLSYLDEDSVKFREGLRIEKIIPIHKNRIIETL
jgi:hypothetical protein